MGENRAAKRPGMTNDQAVFRLARTEAKGKGGGIPYRP